MVINGIKKDRQTFKKKTKNNVVKFLDSGGEKVVAQQFILSQHAAAGRTPKIY